MKLRLYTPVIFLLMLAGCSGSRITHSWKAPDAKPGSYQKLMVIALIKDKDHNMIEQMEKHFVGDLKDMGYNAVSAFSQFGPKAFDGKTEKESLRKLRHTGADAVITIVLLDKSRERHYVPSRIYYSPYGMYSGNFWGYYSTIQSRIYSDGYYQVDTKYFWESNLYDLQTGKLLYSIQTESFDPESTERLVHEYGKLIAKAMVKDQVLVTKPKGF